MGLGPAFGDTGEKLGLYSAYQIGTGFDLLHPKKLRQASIGLREWEMDPPHLLTHSSETFACFTKPNWISKAKST